VYVKVPNPAAKLTLKRKIPLRQQTDSTVRSQQSRKSSSAALNLKASSSIDVLSATDVPAYAGSDALRVSGNMQLPTADTPKNKLLKCKIKRLQSQGWKMSRRIRLLKSSAAKKYVADACKLESVDAVIEAAKPYLTMLQLELFGSQLKASHHMPRGYRWSVKEKLFALQLYYKSAAAYRFLSCHLVLPSWKTLSNFVRNAVGRLDSGFTDVMMNVLRLRVSDLPLCDRQCAVVFDEIALKTHLTFDKHQDRVVGYTDNNKIATHALVFMIRGLHSKWKQALAFFFTHNTMAASTLAELVCDCVDKLQNINLFVRCIVCDQGATNVAALRQLGFMTNDPCLQLPKIQTKIHVIFDVPHLLKNVRNNLQRHDIKVDDSTAQWKHIDQFYQIDKQSSIRLAPKLTDRHIDVTSVAKMRVSLAAQTLSHSVADGIKLRVMTNELSSDAVATADFVDKMDTLFDILNSRVLKADRPTRCPVTNRNSQLSELLKLKSWVDRWVFVGARAQSGIHCHWGLQTSIVSIHALCSALLNEGYSFLCTSRFNQDCVENFFAAIRSKQGWNENPSPYQFTAAFRNAVVLSSLDSTSSGKNCIADSDFALLKHSNFSDVAHALQPSTSDAASPTRPTFATVDLFGDNSNDTSSELLNSDISIEEGIIECFTEAEESLISYMSGWLARKCGICMECQVALCKQLGDHSYCRRVTDDFAAVKRFVGSASVGLVQPCDDLFSVVHTMEECFRMYYQPSSAKPNLAATLYNVIHPKCDFQFLFRRHPEHACYLSEKLTKVYMMMRIFYAVKFENRALMSKKTASASQRRNSYKRKMEKVLHL